MIIALLVIGGSLAFLGWLVFTLAVYALPCFVGVSAGELAFGAGAGVLGAVVVGVVAGVLTFAAGRVILDGPRSTLVRLLILALFVGPAGVAGFAIAHDIAHLAGADDLWAIASGMTGAAVTMAAALARLLPGTEGAGLGVDTHAGPPVARRH